MEKVAKILILACLFLSCEKEYEEPKHCIQMEISNSIPVQFWVNGQETFNEKVVCGITPVCWCQPFHCDDEIVIKIYAPEYSYLILSVLDQDGVSINDLSFVKTGDTHTVQFTPSNIDICDRQISLSVGTSSGEIDLAEQPYSDNWSNDASSGDAPWTIDNDTFEVLFGTVPNPGTTSEIAKRLFTGGGDTVFMHFTAKITNPIGGTYEVFFNFYSFSTLVGTLSKEYIMPGDGMAFNIDDNLSGPIPVYDEIQIVIVHAEGTFSLFEMFTITTSSIFEYLAYTDCISIKENHPCTVLVNYANATAFDGVPDSSPMQSFNIRIPAVFFEEQNTQEQEDIELSNDEIVRLYNKVEEKRLLKIGFMPHYMHRKLLLALVHDFVTIDGKEWIKRDEYKKNEGNRHYPLKSGEVLLTDKNFIKENQL